MSPLLDGTFLDTGGKGSSFDEETQRRGERCLAFVVSTFCRDCWGEKKRSVVRRSPARAGWAGCLVLSSWGFPAFSLLNFWWYANFLLFRPSKPRNCSAVAEISRKLSKLQFQKHPTVNSHAEDWQFAGQKGHQRQSHFSLVTWCGTWLGEFRLRLQDSKPSQGLFTLDSKL